MAARRLTSKLLNLDLREVEGLSLSIVYAELIDLAIATNEKMTSLHRQKARETGAMVSAEAKVWQSSVEGLTRARVMLDNERRRLGAGRKRTR